MKMRRIISLVENFLIDCEEILRYPVVLCERHEL